MGFGVGIGCGSNTKASKQYRRRVLITMFFYLMLVAVAAMMVRHGHPHGGLLYVWAVLPAIPIIAVIAVMGRYLQEETDEYLRSVTVRSMLVATAALLGLIAVSDFLQSFAGTAALPPFVEFIVFFVGLGIAQGVQQLRDRVGRDE